MAYPFEVCNVCLHKYGKIKHKVQSLVESGCLLQPNQHKGVTVRVRIVDDILEPRVRPMPKVFFKGYFVYCDPDRCIGESCTFPHCSKEKEEWNAKKFSIAVSSPPVSAPTSSPSIPDQLVSTDSADTTRKIMDSPKGESSGSTDSPSQQRRQQTHGRPKSGTQRHGGEGDQISEGPSVEDPMKHQLNTYIKRVAELETRVEELTIRAENPWPDFPGLGALYKEDLLQQQSPRETAPGIFTPNMTIPVTLPPQIQSHGVVSASLSSANSSSASSQGVVKATQQQPTVPLQRMPLQPRHTLPPSPQQQVGEKSRNLSLTSSPPQMLAEVLAAPSPERVSKATAPQQSSIFHKPLVVGNYHQRFRELLKSEEIAHSQLLKERCDGKYVLCLYQAGQKPELLNIRPDHARSGYLKGMGCDEVSYATQSASYAVIELGQCSVQCDILQENMRHAEERLYIGFKKEAVKLLSHFGLQGKRAFTSSAPLPVHFRLKFSYFLSLKDSIRQLKKDAISRIFPSSTNFTPIKNAECCMLESYREYCSPDQYEALKVITSTPAAGPPVLIAGPFGTGKTRVLALASHYSVEESVSKNSRLAILVCMQQQTSADAFLAMYINLTSMNEEITIFRLQPKHPTQKNKFTKTVDNFKKEIKRNSFRSQQRYLIVTTCLTAKQIADVLPPWFFTHIFLDEGAQMREPEAVAPLCMASKDTKIVIAGDKFQVGPAMLVLGEEPQKYGLSISLLERLYDLYQELGDVAKPYCAHLSTNFRCHSAIFNLARQVAYKSPLACGVRDHIAHPNAPFPLSFVCTSLDHDVKETKDSICEIEVKASLKEASYFIMKWPVDHWGERDISKMCFLSPCRGQVTVARGARERNLSPQVKHVRKLPTYLIQGQEFRALFISTSEPTTPDGETRDSTKSISDPAVFITAITRARSLVVAVGNPFMLLRREEHMVKKYGDRGHCWSLFLKTCIDNGTLSVYQGESDDTRTGLERLKRMTHEMVSHLNLPPPLEDSNETREIAPSIIVVPETPTKVSPASPQHTAVDTSTELHEFKDHVYEEELGRGGFGVVCRMQHKVDKKRYAVKIVRLCDRPDEEQKVMREVEALARLDHPNIVRYYDSWKSRAPPNWQQISPWKQLPSSYSMSYPSGRRTGETESQTAAPDASATLSPYISSNSSESGPTASAAVVEYSTVDVLHGDAPETEKRRSLNPLRLDPEPPVCLCIKTELCERETLKAWLRAHKEDRKRKEVAAWFVEILKGVMYIHGEGLIHRDLKPSNIFFSLSGRKIKIGDFGLVTTSQVDLGEAASHKSNYVGTSYYISPEQNKKENYGREVDIYALGITYFEMNCPFITDMEKDKVLTALRNDGIFPKHFKDHLYHEAKIIKWMLTVDPQERPSAEEVFSSETMRKLQKSSKRSKATIPLL